MCNSIDEAEYICHKDSLFIKIITENIEKADVLKHQSMRVLIYLLILRHEENNTHINSTYLL